MVTIRFNDIPWFKNEIRKTIRKRDRLRTKVIQFKIVSDTYKYKKQRNNLEHIFKYKIMPAILKLTGKL